ncbi:MAG TPA: carbamoyltransferase HypF [Vicinamibacteria bacterium]
MDRIGRRIEIRGTVQGVGFRPWVYRVAREQGIAGRVKNDARGVVIDAFGAPDRVDAFVHRIEASPPPAARIRELRTEAIPAEPARGFRIVPSAPGGARRVTVPPDLATCPDCEREIFDPADRRFGYAFTNCTSCGPRFSILRDLPYDRASTTMARFAMCPDCQREYRRFSDRRFHAQPNACPSCGPRLLALTPDGTLLPASDAVAAAASYLDAGRIVALKGIGGYHLACDATSSAAVAELRRRKNRDQKPFAVMVRDLPAARRVARMGEEERALLTSVERPIVLLERRPDSSLAPEVAPDNPLVGLLLPYSPLHHLLMAAAERPLVMTSGNLSGEPIAYRDDDAFARLGAIADVFLLHDRDIHNRCDDSVARVIAGKPVLLRRSRGYVPRPVALARPVERPVLGCGGHLKNAFCIAVGDSAYLGAHVGDLESVSTVQAFEEAVERLERLLGVRPEIVAHDLHPGYLSTAYALSRQASFKVGVQHHHAHVASALAEHGLRGPVLGVAYDGTGYGTDGTAWGGEILLADAESFDRLATFRPLPLPGSDVAVRQVWRIALAAIDDAYAGQPPLTAIPLFRSLPEKDVAAVRQAAAGAPVLAPLARGVGRYFDALGALVLGRGLSHHEGQVAMEWNLAADPSERGAYPFVVDEAATPWVLDLRPVIRAAVDDLVAGRSPAVISGRFHNTLARATAALLRAAAARVGRRPVVLTGGVFQNALLAERVLAELGGEFEVHLHGQVPPGDGGLALGQALIADAMTRRGAGESACA